MEKIQTCKDCMKILGIERSDFVFNTNLCALHVQADWTEDIIKAISFLKQHKITSEQYDRVRISCKEVLSNGI